MLAVSRFGRQQTPALTKLYFKPILSGFSVHIYVCNATSMADTSYCHACGAYRARWSATTSQGSGDEVKECEDGVLV